MILNIEVVHLHSMGFNVLRFNSTKFRSAQHTLEIWSSYGPGHIGDCVSNSLDFFLKICVCSGLVVGVEKVVGSEETVLHALI